MSSRAKLGRLTLALVLVSALALSCAGRAGGEASVARRVHSLASYPFTANLPLESRIGPVPAFVLAYLKAMDKTEAYRPYAVPDSEKALFKSYLAYLPPVYAKVMADRVVGFYFVDGLAGGGMTDYVLGAQGRLYVIVILNPALLQLPLNQWIAQRDASSFVAEPGFSVTNSLPSTYVALLHTLVHEASHVYDYVEGATPFVSEAISPVHLEPRDKAFTAGVWEAYAKPLEACDFAGRAQVASYGLGPRLPASKAFELYDSLSRTPFSSLYASSSWAEDFAEAATWAWLQKRCGISYRVDLRAPDQPDLSFSPAPSSPGRLLLLKGILGL